MPPQSYTLPKIANIGIVGTGFIASGLLAILLASPIFKPTKVFTRRSKSEFKDPIASHITNSLAELIETSDIIVECSGDVHHATEVVEAAFKAHLPVITMGTEFQVTVGSYFAGRGMITEAEGDQPGCLAALHEEVSEMGFKPLVYGNIKGFLNHHPTLDEMKYWAQRQGISLTQVTSFTDGTKMQMEQAFIGNGMGTDILKQGLVGPVGVEIHEGGDILGALAHEHGSAVSDYILNPKLPAGVFIVAEHPSAGADVLRYLKLGEGPYYTLKRPYHLCHLEIPRTLRRILSGGPPLLNNSVNPTLGVCAIAKADIPAGSLIHQAIGGFQLRGEAFRLKDIPEAPPLGLLSGARFRRNVRDGETVTLDDVELPDTAATRVWREMHESRTALIA